MPSCPTPRRPQAFVPTRPGALARRAALLTLGAAMLLAGCGGGGDGGSDTAAAASGTGGGTGTGSGGATTASAPTATAYATGTVTGLGSIIVNGVRYDDSSARVLGDDDTELRDDRRRVKLGMHVDVASGAVDDSTLRARAETVRVGSELVGTVERVTLDASGALQSFVLLGQTVRIQRPGTVVDDSLPGGLAGITVGRVLEVHATFDGTAYLASFIELRPATAVARFKVRGSITAVDTTARTFRIGGATFSYAGLAADALTVTPAVGLLVRVEVSTTATTSGGVLQALSVRAGVRPSSTVTAGTAVGDARVRGTITQALSASTFSLDGTPVRIDSSTRFDKGSAASLLLGVVVEVRGVLQSGVLVASRITVRAADDRAGGLDDVGGIELHGTASAIDLAANRFTLTHSSGATYTVTYTIDADAIVSSSPKLEVKGTLSADGRSIAATSIKRED